MLTPRNIQEAIVGLNASISLLEPIVLKLQKGARFLEANPGDLLPTDLQGEYVELAAVDRLGFKSFKSHQDLYMDLFEEWIDISLQKLKMTTVNGLAAHFSEKLVLLRKALAIAETRLSQLEARIRVNSVFLSHNSQDKPFVRRLAARLRENGVRVWLDEAELNVGDTLFGRIGGAIKEMGNFIVVLSLNSITSRWVQEELAAAMARQFKENQVVVLPVLLEDVGDAMPAFLEDKIFADFRDLSKFERSLGLLLRSMGVLHPFADIVAELPELKAGESYDGRTRREHVEGREFIKRLASFTEMDLPNNRIWIAWELTKELLDGRYVCDLVVGRSMNDDTLFEVRFWDPFIRYPIFVTLYGESFRQGIWEFNEDWSSPPFEHAPREDQRPVLSGGLLDGRQTFPTQERIENPATSGAGEVMKPILDELLPQVSKCNEGVKRVVVADLQRLLISLGVRTIRLRVGQVRLHQCALWRPKDGETVSPTCDQTGEGTLYFELYDSFFNTFNSLFLCAVHSSELFDADIDLFAHDYNLPVLGNH